MKNSILFVHPNASRKIYQGLSTNLSAIEPPIWAALLANHMRSHGYQDVSILDCEAENLSDLKTYLQKSHQLRLKTLMLN